MIGPTTHEHANKKERDNTGGMVSYVGDLLMASFNFRLLVMTLVPNTVRDDVRLWPSPDPARLPSSVRRRQVPAMQHLRTVASKSHVPRDLKARLQLLANMIISRGIQGSTHDTRTHMRDSSQNKMSTRQQEEQLDTSG